MEGGTARKSVVMHVLVVVVVVLVVVVVGNLKCTVVCVCVCGGGGCNEAIYQHKNRYMWGIVFFFLEAILLLVGVFCQRTVCLNHELSKAMQIHIIQ